MLSRRLVQRTTLSSSSAAACCVRSKSTLTQVPNIYNNIRSASNVKPAYQPGLHQHRAPSTPGVNITPDAFLPANDPRKGLDLAGSNTVDIKNAPALSTPKEQTLNLTPVEVEEIKRLRLEDPAKWTRGALAEKFGVSGFTISLVSDVEKGWKKEMDGRLQHIKNRWNKGRAQARRDREKRKVDWYRDE